ncbi:unnamed protein product [Sphenostylis stenocarpa]|uniref:Uncharacterized protein n=1 Tax=Sphenostylis stenocarpa TaxID=92480 RepID=A0AA86S5L3_9FABA|nr:unnamed protein product [Sphenostylis stenocarpa]
MGNCQAAEAATVVIQHPGNKIERIYWSLSAHQVMDSNPGHYVALVVTSSTLKSENGTPMKQLKLLRPDDTLHIGQVYRLISFEDVLKEFASKKCGKLGKLLKETGGHGIQMKHRDSRAPNPNPTSKSEYGSNKVIKFHVLALRQVKVIKWFERATLAYPANLSNKRFNEWSAMAAVAAAVTKVLEGISLVLVGNGGQPYRALQKLELERTITPTPMNKPCRATTATTLPFISLFPMHPHYPPHSSIIECPTAVQSFSSFALNLGNIEVVCGPMVLDLDIVYMFHQHVWALQFVVYWGVEFNSEVKTTVFYSGDGTMMHTNLCSQMMHTPPHPQGLICFDMGLSITLICTVAFERESEREMSAS